MTSLTGKTIVVSGASGYLGSFIAKACEKEGATMILLGRSIEKLRNLQKAQFKGATNVHIVAGEVNHQEAANTLVFKIIETFNVPDVVINCLGHAEDKPFVFHKASDAAQSLQSNVFPVINICEAFIPHFIANKKGNIINMVSITGLVGQPMRSLYGAAKGAVIAYSKAIARRYAACGLRVNCVAPQVVAGGMANRMSPKIKKLLQDTTPIPRDCIAEDLLGPVLMLAKEEKGFITGETVKVTGGLITW